MAESRIPAAIDGIVNAWTPTGLTIVDGPSLSADYWNRPVVFVGWDGDQDGEFLSASSEQDWAGIGTKRRDESIVIPGCVIYPFGNSTTWKPVRDGCAAMLDQLGDALRADPSIGLPPPSWAGLVPGNYHQHLVPEAGALARQVFNIRIQTRV